MLTSNSQSSCLRPGGLTLQMCHCTWLESNLNPWSLSACTPTTENPALVMLKKLTPERRPTWRAFRNFTFVASFFLQLPKSSRLWAFSVFDEPWRTDGKQASLEHLSDNR